jgi:hypothetical protein
MGDGKMSQRRVEILLDLRPGDARLTLRGMHSLMEIPSSSDEEVKILHASFPDFVFNSSRSGPFHVDRSAFYTNISSAVLGPLSKPCGCLQRSGSLDRWYLVPLDYFIQPNFWL